ncbi:MAG: glycosyl transferase family 2 [Halobacteriales archaeon]
MDYAQERIATLHDLSDHRPDAPVDAAAVVVPLAEREAGSLAAERTFERLESVAPGAVIVPLRANPDQVEAVRDWLSAYDLPLELLWCGGGRLTELLADRGLNGDAGKGRDLWLALGVAMADHEYVVCHDADRRTYSATDVPRLLAPLADGFEFSKGYYARVENGRLYGRLWRLLYVPLVRALAETADAPVLDYLDAFRYGLAGEFALTARLAESLRIERRFGLEVGTLGGAFAAAGFEGTAQVDLGRYAHDHRAVSGPDGLATMAEDVSAALFRVVEAAGVELDYEALPDRYRTVADALIDQYAADAAHNGLEFDRSHEAHQVEQYADAIRPPGRDTRLPPWSDVALVPDEVRDAVTADLAAVGGA